VQHGKVVKSEYFGFAIFLMLKNETLIESKEVFKKICLKMKLGINATSKEIHHRSFDGSLISIFE
jgi:hypothetical protein